MPIIKWRIPDSSIFSPIPTIPAIPSCRRDQLIFSPTKKNTWVGG